MTSEQPSASTSSSAASPYSPVLINPIYEPTHTRSHARNPSSVFVARQSSQSLTSRPFLTLNYPYLLPVLALLDLGYDITTHTRAVQYIPTHLIALSATRAGILGVIVGCSRRWRNRGGWIAGSSGISIGFAVWTFCAGLLDKEDKGNKGRPGVSPLNSGYLLITVLMATFEFLAFVLLLRLSPPTHRNHPFALRLPHSAVQTSTPFQYQTSEENDPETGQSSNSAFRRTMSTSRRFSRISRSASGRVSILQHLQATDSTEPNQTNEVILEPDTPDEHYQDEYDFDPDPDIDDTQFSDEDDLSETSTTSSVSESSIIDLPPPQLPARIIPPTSLSLSRGLDVIANAGIDLETSPVIGNLVRRSRSARFLAQSWGSRDSAMSEAVEGDRQGDGYGTFGQR